MDDGSKPGSERLFFKNTSSFHPCISLSFLKSPLLTNTAFFWLVTNSFVDIKWWCFRKMHSSFTTELNQNKFGWNVEFVYL